MPNFSLDAKGGYGVIYTMVVCKPNIAKSWGDNRVKIWATRVYRYSPLLDSIRMCYNIARCYADRSLQSIRYQGSTGAALE